MTQRQIGQTLLRLVQGDLTMQDVDAIVNAANPSLMGGGGVDGAIHRAGGPAIKDECRAIISRIGRLATGKAVITSAGRMPARHVVHTVGPVWHGGTANEDELLADAYRNSLQVAADNGCRTLAFPSISTGAYGFPTDRAARIALQTMADAIPHHRFDEVRVVLFLPGDLEIYAAALSQIP
ncbi:MAG TPA: O-acetyl-ADP-ribose deacetylase [Planctomycetota bacterium]|nr:O-acetyl-ADP-ribose deacetylase [Planctomycetota bacterium]HRR80659.1 O-acetyl-ADP-ribose deacetylase [Planctomycetota bacterium]HRT95018.1 O-acetyl-ADP-ribose deacetylase [Planctomycetota bacterium]